MSDMGFALFKFLGDRSNLDQTWDSVERDNTSWAERLSTGITGAITTAVTGAVVAATGALTGLAAGGLNAFIGFERGMNEVFTLLPGSSQAAMGAMADDVQAFALEFGALPRDVIPALYESLSSGVPAGNVFDFLATAQKAAVGGVTDTKTTVDGLTSVVNAYGADVLSVERASDIMFTGVAYGKTTFAELAASLYNVIPNAQALGVQFSDVTAAIAAMTAQGVPTAQSTTQIRQLLIELSQAGGEASDIFQRVAGTGFKDFIASGHSLQDALILMEAAAQQSGVGINDLFSSVEAGGAALTLTGRGTESFSAALEQMANSAGATDAAYAQMDQGLGRSIDRIKASFQVLLTDVGERLAPSFQVFADWVSGTMPQISSVVLSVFDAIGGAISTVLPYFQSFAAGVQHGFGVFIELGSAAAQWGANIGQQLANGIMAAASAVVSSLSYLGGLITYWLEPHSPPKLLPHLDQWGTDAANVYMAGWGEADFSVFDRVGSTIEGLLKGMVDSDTLPEEGYIPMLLGSREAVAAALNQLRTTGSVSEAAFRSVRDSAGAAGEQVDRYFRSLVALEQVNRQAAAAQENLNAITKKYDAILSPLEEELAAIEDAQTAVQEQAEAERLLRLINSTGGKDSDREAARLELEALRLRQKIRETKDAQETEEAAAQSQVDAAAEARAALEADLALQEQQIAARQKQNTLIQQQIDLITKAMTAGGGGGGGGSAMDDAAKKAEHAAKAQRDYNYAVADTDTKLAMLKEDQAKYTQSDAEYWRLQGQISGLENQRQQELDASAEAQRDYQLSLQDTETRLASLKEEQSQYAVGSEDYNRIQKDIDKVEKERAKQLEEVEKKNAEAARAERDYQYAVADTGGKLDILRGELANTTEGSADYWRIKTQINTLEGQAQKELEASSKAMGGAGAATGGLASGVGNLSGSLDALKTAAVAGPGPIGDLQAAVEGAANPFVALKDKQQEFADSISTGLSPAAATAGMIIESIKGFFTSISPILQPVIAGIQGFITTITTGFQEGGIGGAINAAATALAGISPVFALVKGAVDAALPPIQSMVTSVFGIIAGFIQTNGADILTFVQTTWTSIQGVINTILPPIQTAVSTVFGAIATFLSENSGSIQGVLTLAWETIKTVIDGVMLVINEIIVPGFTTIATFIGTHGEEIKGLIQGAWDIIKGIVETVLGVIQGVVQTVMALIKGDWQGAWDAIKGIVQTVWDGIKTIVDGALTLLGSALSIAWDAIKGVAQLGWDAIKGVVTTVWDGIKLAIDTVLGTITGALQTAWDAIKLAAETAWTAVKDALIGPFQAAYDTISGMVQSFIQIGTDIVDGITGAIWGGGGKVAAALTGVMENAKNQAKTDAEIQSPSRLFAREIGAHLPGGIAMGIDEATPDVTRSIRQTMRHLIEAAKTPTIAGPGLLALPAAAAAGGGAAPSGGGNVYHITIPVDARGATNSAETEAAVLRGVKKAIAELEAKIGIKILYGK